MNKFFRILALGSVLVLSACGGDSDSSGSNNSTPTNPTPTPTNPTPTNPTLATCASTGTSPATVNVTVPEGGSCTYSVPFINSGDTMTYTCSNGTLSSGGVISGGGINFNNYQFRCDE